METHREFVVEGAGQKRFTTIDQDGRRRTYDLDNPDREMLKQMCDVASRRTNDTHEVLKMIYIENEGVPEAQPIKDIFQSVVDGEITPEQAKAQILQLKESL